MIDVIYWVEYVWIASALVFVAILVYAVGEHAKNRRKQ